MGSETRLPFVALHVSGVLSKKAVKKYICYFKQFLLIQPKYVDTDQLKTQAHIKRTWGLGTANTKTAFNQNNEKFSDSKESFK